MRFALLALLSTAMGYHCSNDAPVETPAQKLAAHAAYAPAHLHPHSEDDLPAPGYRAAAALIEARLASPPQPLQSTLRWPQPPPLAAVPVPLSSVALLPGGRAFASQNLSSVWIHSLDPERLLFSFRETANLSTAGAQPYGGWESPDCLLRGHIAGGHFLSGAALLSNATGDAALRARVGYMVAELQKCQAANTAKGWAGYLSAFPPDHFDRLERNQQPIWAPYYTMHKILQGLYDAHALLGDPNAAPVALGMLAYFAKRVRALISQETIAEWYAVLNIEHGGMNEVAFKWAAATGSADAAYLAQMFDEPCWLGPLSLGADILTDEHANTHLPIVLGAATQFERTGDLRLSLAATGFYSALQGAHTFSTGGSSSGEWWGRPHRLGDELDVNGVESCSTYNVMKLSRQLFGWGADPALMGHFERALFSGMYGTQHPSRVGAVIYLLPLRGPNGLAGGSKAHSYWGWSDPEASMWCCVGSALESHSKHGDSLFFEAAPAPGAPPTLILATYENARVAWPIPGARGGAIATLTTTAAWSATNLTVRLQLSVAGGAPGDLALALRVPAWGAAGAAASVDGSPLPVPEGAPWVNISRAQWGAAELVLPFAPVLEALDDDRAAFAGYFSVVAGPFVLGALTRVDNVIVGANRTGAPAPWVRPLSAAERSAALSLGAPGGAAHLRHDNVTAVWAGSAAAAPPYTPSADEGPGDATWLLEDAAAPGEGRALRSLNRPGELLACAAAGAQCVIAHGAAAGAASSFTVHSPGLSGAVGTLSLESRLLPGFFVSTFASPRNSSEWGAAVALQRLAPGDAAFAAASSWAAGAALWSPPALTYVASTGDGAVEGSRDLLLVPVADIADEWYGIYLKVVSK